MKRGAKKESVKFGNTKKEGWLRSNALKADEELDKWLKDEMRSEKKEEERKWKLKTN